MPIDISKVITAEQKDEAARAETVEQFRAAIQAMVDHVAQGRRYDSGNSLASYVASTNEQWAAEAQAFVSWRDEVWIYAYAELAKVQGGEREQPSVAAFLDEIEPIVWPTLETNADA